MAKNRRHVVPSPNRTGFDSVNPQGGRTHHRTQQAAEQAAKRDLRRTGGGEAVIHNRRGQIRDSDTVPPARDPNPPRDTKH